MGYDPGGRVLCRVRLREKGQGREVVRRAAPRRPRWGGVRMKRGFLAITSPRWAQLRKEQVLGPEAEGRQSILCA